MVTDLRYRLDVHTLHRDEGVAQLALNEIGRVTLRATSPLFADDYRRNRDHGQLRAHRRGDEPDGGRRHARARRAG